LTMLPYGLSQPVTDSVHQGRCHNRLITHSRRLRLYMVQSHTYLITSSMVNFAWRVLKFALHWSICRSMLTDATPQAEFLEDK